jgi:ribosomal protein S6--L-glutamate ligase
MTVTRMCCLVEQRYLRQRMPAAVIEVLRAQDVAVDIVTGGGGRFDPRRGTFHGADGGATDLNCYHALIARGRDALTLAMLAYGEAAGATTVNSHRATEAVRNKAHLAIALERAGIPSAPTVLAADVADLRALPDTWFPLILKATYGDNSQGLRVVRHPEDLEDVHWGDALVLAQHYIPNSGYDLKLYVCGEHVWATHKPSPFNGKHDAPVRPAEADEGMRDLALRCGQVFGLEIYGVDALETTDGLAVVEVNEFPNFTGVADAPTRIAAHVRSRLS